MSERVKHELGPIGRELMRETLATHAAGELRRTFRWFSPLNYQPPTSGRKWDDEAIRHGGASSMEHMKLFRIRFSDSVNHGREAALELLRRRFTP